jgi:YHS domain-containing protein
MKTSKIFALAGTVCICLMLVVPSFAKDKVTPLATLAKKPQTTCPITGEAIMKDVFIDFQGQRIYFCCAGCEKQLLADPEKYFKIFAEQNILLESIQKVCPVSGKPINKNIYADYKGRRVYFDSEKSKEVFLKDPEIYLKKL